MQIVKGDAWKYLTDNIENYCFYEDERMLDETLFEEEDDGNYNTDAAEAYWENIMDYSNVEEITEEEYNENSEG